MDQSLPLVFIAFEINGIFATVCRTGDVAVGLRKKNGENKEK